MSTFAIFWEFTDRRREPNFKKGKSDMVFEGNTSDWSNEEQFLTPPKARKRRKMNRVKHGLSLLCNLKSAKHSQRNYLIFIGLQTPVRQLRLRRTKNVGRQFQIIGYEHGPLEYHDLEAVQVNVLSRQQPPIRRSPHGESESLGSGFQFKKKNKVPNLERQLMILLSCQTSCWTRFPHRHIPSNSPQRISQIQL